MSSAAAAFSSLFPVVRPPYPERPEHDAQGWLEETGERLIGRLTRAARARRVMQTDIAALVRRHEASLGELDAEGIRERARELGKQLRRDGFEPDIVARTFALVRLASTRVLGMR